MCGIAGIIGRSVNRNVIAGMIKVLEHRGPDHQDIFQDKGIALGHTRLSINDLSSYSNQPFIRNDNVLVFNGEIYNFKELNKCRSTIDHHESDTETLFELIQQEGLSGITKLNGMFSFAFWDSKKKELIAARDRFGEKPFYYSLLSDRTIVFASEIKAIIASGLVGPVIDQDQIVHYLRFLHVQPDRTIYKNIHLLCPGEHLSYCHGEIKINKYWRLPSQKLKISFQEAKHEFRKKMEKAVERQLSASVDVGVFLSGGLDSSTLVGIGAQVKGKLKTFSFGFKERSELKYAREVAEKYSTEHYELFETDLNIAGLLIRMQQVYDEPFADSSNIPTYILSEFARKKVKVVMGGDGADELLAGYSGWYNRITEFQNFKNSIISNDILSLCYKKFPEGFPIIGKFARFKKIESKSCDYVDAFRKLRSFSDDRTIRELGLNINDFYSDDKMDSTLSMENILLDGLNHYLPGDILTKSDRASMANSLELRTPFLDLDVAEFLCSLPAEYKFKDGVTKRILRDEFEGNIIPDTIVKRNKQGFGAPVNKWLQDKDVTDLINEYLKNKNRTIFNYLSYDGVQRNLKVLDYKVWSYLVLSLWFENSCHNN